MRLIDADAYAAEMKKRQDACMDVMESDSHDGEQFSFKEHWGGVFAAFAEAKLTLDDMPTIQRWVSVKDRLPEENVNPYTQDYQEVLCVLSTRFGTDVRVYKFGKGHFWNGPQEIDRMISHWMSFPELPEEEKENGNMDV